MAAATRTIDMRGKQITTFILYAATSALRTLEEGEALGLLVDDFEAIDNDVWAWSRATGNLVLDVERAARGKLYTIEKGASSDVARSLALVVSDAGMLELLSPLGFALGAALEGVDVSVYFQGPGVRVLSTRFRGRLRGLARPFSRWAQRGLEGAGHVPAQEKLRQLHELGARIYACGPSMERYGVSKRSLILDDIVIAEYLTFMEVMVHSDIHLYV